MYETGKLSCVYPVKRNHHISETYISNFVILFFYLVTKQKQQSLKMLLYPAAQNDNWTSWVPERVRVRFKRTIYWSYACLDWRFLMRHSMSRWPAEYCSITSMTSYGRKLSLNFLFDTRNFIILRKQTFFSCDTDMYRSAFWLFKKVQILEEEQNFNICTVKLGLCI